MRPLRVGGGVVAGRLVVPVQDQAAPGVHDLGVSIRRCEAQPLVLAGALGEQARIDRLRSDREPPGGDLRDRPVVDVVPVERELEAGGEPTEVRRRANRIRRELDEERRCEQLPVSGRAPRGDRDSLALHGRVADHGPVDGLVVLDEDVGRAGARLERAGLEPRHLTALALVDVLHIASVAERLRVLVDEVGAGGRGRPCVVETAPDQHCERDTGERGPPGVEPAAVQVELEHDARVVVADLRPRNHQRSPRGRAASADEQRVRHAEAGGRERGGLGRGRADRGEAVGVDDDVPELARRPATPRERARDGDAALEVVAEAEVLPRAPPGVGPETRLQQCEEVRATQLVAAPGPEHGADQPGDADDIGSRPGSDGQLRSAVGGVDARDVRVDQSDDPLAGRALALEKSKLRPEPRLGGRTRGERLARQREREGIEAGHVERGRLAGASQQLHDQLPILSRHPTRTERDVDVAAAVDVRHAEAIAPDRDTGSGPLDAYGLLTAQAERLTLEEA